MTLRKALLWILFVDFAVFSTWVLWDTGYLGIWLAGMASPASAQILLDLVISCLLISVWIKGDAEQRGINPWPWMIAIGFTGSLATLVYLLVREYQVTPALRQARGAV